MARYRTYTIEFKRRVAEEHLSGGVGLSELARRHDISRELLRLWVRKYEAGEFASGGFPPGGPRAPRAAIARPRPQAGAPPPALAPLQKGVPPGPPAGGAESPLVHGPAPPAP